MILTLGALLATGLVVLRHSMRPIPVAVRLARYGVVVGTIQPSFVARIVTHVQGRFVVDPADVAISGTTTRAIAVKRLILALLGFGLPIAIWFAAALGRIVVPLPMVMLSALGLTTIGFRLPARRVQVAARQNRRRFRTSLSAYLDLVSVMLAGGAGIETALHAAARIGDGFTFETIAVALDLARTTRRSPWDTLAETGSRYGVDELPELAATVRLGGEQGARMTASLVAKASAMRAREMADVEARANEATERMGLPMVLLFIGFLVLLGYPAMQLITSGFEG